MDGALVGAGLGFFAGHIILRQFPSESLLYFQAASSTTSPATAVGVASVLALTIVEAYSDPVFMENNGV